MGVVGWVGADGTSRNGTRSPENEVQNGGETEDSTVDEGEVPKGRQVKSKTTPTRTEMGLGTLRTPVRRKGVRIDDS